MQNRTPNLATSFGRELECFLCPRGVALNLVAVMLLGKPRHAVYLTGIENSQNPILFTRCLHNTAYFDSFAGQGTP